MSNPSDRFECRWQPSRTLLRLYLPILALALLAPWLSALPLYCKLLLCTLCLAHGAWVLPRHILLSTAHACRGLRRDAQGWHLWSEAAGWQPVRLRPDSLALPELVLLRYCRAGERRVRSLCIARDSLSPDVHRRLRLRLKFSRRRWSEPVGSESE